MKGVYGKPITLRQKSSSFIPTDFCEDYMAAVLGEDGSPDSPVVYFLPEGQFYAYEPDFGIYVPISQAKLEEKLSKMFQNCALECEGGTTDITPLEMNWRNSGKLRGIINKAKGVLEKSADFFTVKDKTLALKNGQLHLDAKSLTSFGPSLGVRFLLPVHYDITAQCPMFEEFIYQALPAYDIEIVQKWAGQLLYGRNICHKLLIFTGIGGAGKSTLAKILMEVLGTSNVVTLRPNLLGDRFEIGRYLGRRLLYGADVPSDFLNSKYASVIKSLVGGDPMTIETKFSNDRIEIKGEFNVLITSNAPLPVYMDSDVEAWDRRLMLVKFEKIPAKKNFQLSDQIIQNEMSGVLNWMIQGYDRLKNSDWRFDFTDQQQQRIDDILQLSQSVEVFATKNLAKDYDHFILSQELYISYKLFCEIRRWEPLVKHKFSGLAEKEIYKKFGLNPRNDLCRGDSGAQKGWKGIRII